MNCPRCHATLEHATYCTDCGWTRPTKPAEAPQLPGIQRCAYVATESGEQCHYPGTNWNNLRGDGPGYCREHIRSDISFSRATAVVVESRRYQRERDP